eukprot:SAG31_NODE_10512_length_1130_cov_0.909796_2_plen_90_part_01
MALIAAAAAAAAAASWLFQHFLPPVLGNKFSLHLTPTRSGTPPYHAKDPSLLSAMCTPQGEAALLLAGLLRIFLLGLAMATGTAVRHEVI